MGTALTTLFRLTLIACTCGVVIPAFGEDAEVEEKHRRYSRRQLRNLEREARTPQQYQVLAAWFRAEEAGYLARASAEWKKYGPYITAVRSKQPTSADAALERYGYYRYKADQMAVRAVKYESLLPPAQRTPALSAESAAASSDMEKTLVIRIDQLEREMQKRRGR